MRETSEKKGWEGSKETVHLPELGVYESSVTGSCVIFCFAKTNFQTTFLRAVVVAGVVLAFFIHQCFRPVNFFSRFSTPHKSLSIPANR